VFKTKGLSLASIRGGVVAKVVIGSTRPWPTTLTGPLLGI
jgi:hypothetical protein